jgi:hypothetical protein
LDIDSGRGRPFLVTPQMKTGAKYGYRALVRIPVSSFGPFTGLSSKKGCGPGELIGALQADLALIGLIVTQYKVTGKFPNYGIALEITPMKSFFSTQSIQSLVDQVIQQQTGAKPEWSMDPCCCVVTPPTFATNCCVTKATLAMISPSGANPFAPCNPNSTINKYGPCGPPCFHSSLIYGAGSEITAGYNAVKNSIPCACKIESFLKNGFIIIVGVGLLALFVFGKAGGHIG